MMKGLIVIFICMLVAMLVSGCTENIRTQQWGGTLHVDIPKSEQFVNATWKQDRNLWVLTKERDSDHRPQKYYFREHSSLGVLEGEVVFTEK